MGGWGTIVATEATTVRSRAYTQEVSALAFLAIEIGHSGRNRVFFALLPEIPVDAEVNRDAGLVPKVNSCRVTRLAQCGGR